MELLCNIYLSQSDKKLIENHVNKVQTDFVLSLDSLEDELMKDHLKCLGWMLQNNKLEIKIAVIENKPGIQHEKIGILEDSEGNIVSFMGSENETWMGWLGNNEKFHVFRSWNPGEKEHLESDIEDFNAYWNNYAHRAHVYPISDAVKKGLIRIAPKSADEFIVLNEKITKQLIARNREITRSIPYQREWPHKKLAIDTFITKKHGIIEMATGTGKTSVAISIMNNLFNKSKIDGAIVTTYGNDLLDQWYQVLCEKADENLAIYRFYDDYHELEDFFVNPKFSILLISWTNLYVALIDNAAVNSKLLVCDEVHGFGAPSLRKSLKGKIKQLPYRMGLSATSEREYDAEGNEFIEEEIGPVIFTYDLKDAIKNGILCEFDYVPLSYKLDKEDRSSIQHAYKVYYAKINQNHNEAEAKKELYMNLARVRKLSKSKVPVFHDFIKSNVELLKNALIFVETMEYGKLVQDVIIKFNPNYHTYYSDDEKANLENFSKDEINLLITCKRISQGIDVKSIKNIILFSSSRGKLETTQRIGRCLRTNPDDPTKRATVLDFITEKKDSTDSDDRDDADENRKNWLSDLSRTRKGQTR